MGLREYILCFIDSGEGVVKGVIRGRKPLA